MGDFQKIYILQTDFEGKKIPALKKILSCRIILEKILLRQ